ncbi:MAG: flavin prenyltransferase UbiX [Venatoribacter sp.]
MNNRICIAITGASGSLYALRLIEVLLQAGRDVDVLISKAAQLVLAMEVNMAIPPKPQAQAEFLRSHFKVGEERLRVYGREDWLSPWASGSAIGEAVVVCPCSTGTLSAIATGASNNLIERAADVALKERRKLILVTREAPYSEIHLENMLKLTRMGAVILPANPGFYHLPTKIEDLIDFVVARILNQLGLEQSLMQAWGYSAQSSG